MMLSKCSSAGKSSSVSLAKPVFGKAEPILGNLFTGAARQDEESTKGVKLRMWMQNFFLCSHRSCHRILIFLGILSR